MTNQEIAAYIAGGNAVLGIEFGSTRIKGVLIDGDANPIAEGDHTWENRLDQGIWTYTLDDVWGGIQDTYANLAKDVQTKYGVELTSLKAIGISAMMHGYLAFDKDDNLLVPFRTWRNTMTAQAVEILSKEFNFNIPQRWSIAHLYQAILSKEPHVPQITFFTTLAGYVHWQLTGEKVLGVGDASGMFPIAAATGDYDKDMAAKFDKLVDGQLSAGLLDLLPKALPAGAAAGCLTAEGAKKLDPTGKLQPGVPMAPPEGDAGTGMVATNSVRVRTGNVSAGTSIFAMVVMDEYTENVHEELDMVTTPDGKPVAMVHCNNCTSDLNSWVGLFGEFAKAIGTDLDPNDLYGTLYRKSLEADADCDGLVSFNYFAGEPVTGFDAGRPLFVRKPDSKMNLANFMRSNLYASMATLKVGLDILLKEEKVPLDRMYGHGGLFKTKGVGQRYMAACMDTPVSLMETAGEGGPWGMAILAAYMADTKGKTLPDYLQDVVFKGDQGESMDPVAEDVAGFNAYLENYKACFAAEHAAVDGLK